MPLESSKLTTLQALPLFTLAEVIAVYWDGESNPPTYYGRAAYNELPNFLDIPYSPIAPRVIAADALTEIPLFPDINSPSFNVTFADSDGDIRSKLMAMKSGGSVKAEIIYYFADVDDSSVMWFGHITHNAPYGVDKQEIEFVTGFQSPEFLLPSEIHMKECSARAFGGELTTTADVYRSICPYDLQTGGSEGVFESGSTPFSDCPRMVKADCTARFGHDRYWPGYDFEAPGVTVSSRFIQTKAVNNDSLLRYPITIVFGAKILMELPVLQFYTRIDSGNNNRGTVHILAEVSNDHVQQIFNAMYSGSTSNVQSYQARNGARGQSPTSWTAGVANYSGRSFLYIVGNHSSNPQSLNVASIKVGCFVHGFDRGRVYTDATTFTNAWTHSRAWPLLELYTNNRWGLGYRHDRFELADWVTLADWMDEDYTFTLPFPSGDKTWDITERTIFDAALTALPAAEQITNICRTGRFSVPYQRDGKYTVRPLKKASSGDLSGAAEFTDAIGGNIKRTSSDSTLKLQQTDPKSLPNTVVSTFEDADNNDIQRPVTCRDMDQLARAGASLGSGGFLEVKKSVPAYGVRRLQECIAFGYSVLWFGEFDSGGIYNNCKATFVTTLREALNLDKFEVIKLVTDQPLPDAPDATSLEYFRVVDGKINADGSVSVTCQAYNQNWYDVFESALSGSATEDNTTDDFTARAVVDDATVATAYADGILTVDLS